MDFLSEKQLLMKASLNVRLKTSKDAERKLDEIAVKLERTKDEILKCPSDLTNYAQNLEQKVTNCTNELLKCESDVSDCKMRQKDALMQLDASQRSCENEEAKLNSLTADVNLLDQKATEKQKTVSVEVARAQQMVDLSRNTLGLRIRKIKSTSEHHHEFTFTNIDKREPEKTFSISLKMNDNGSFSVTNCHPRIHDLNRLVARLNETLDWHSFLVVLRQRFLDSVSQP